MPKRPRNLKKINTIVLLMIVGLAVILGIIVAIAVFFAAARLTASIPVLLFAASVALLATTGSITSLATGRLVPRHQLFLSASLAGGTLLFAGLLASFTVFRPFNFPHTPLVVTAQTRYWNLPTESRIAYELYPAIGTPQPTPIILLHGGPGLPIEDASDMAKPLAQAGFNVYTYDQVGGGRSERLSDIREYTVERHVADLEAIRKEIGVKQVVLLGGSWGATLAAYYMAEHSEHVAKTILISPGDLWPPGLYSHNKSEKDARTDFKQSPDSAQLPATVMTRLIALNSLLRVNPKAARNLADDKEMDSFMDGLLKKIGLQSAVCDPSKTPPPIRRGSGWYVNAMTNLSLEKVPDPRPKLSVSPIPTLILRGECETIPFDVTNQYMEALPQARLIKVKDAGHFIAFEQPKYFSAVVRAFLQEQPLPVQ